jgi:dipeptidyl aminopeptidase/acylaminoacyl peptidase
VYWSQELGILITSEINDDISTVSTYTYDGVKLSSYQGGLWAVSPSGTKILTAKDTLIDLRTNKRINLVWPENDNEQRSSRLYWNMDETRVYRCCYYFADISTGQSFSFELSDFRQPNGDPGPSSILPHAYGQWVRNGTHFLMEWSWIDDGDIRYLPMFDPAKKRFYDIRQMVGISEDWSCQQTRVSPDGTYVWMTGWGEEGEGSYLVDLFTFESQYYPGREYLNIDWSPDSKFAWLFSSDPAGKTETYSILSVEDKEIRPAPVPPIQSRYWWNNVNDILAYPSEDKNSLIFLDASTMSFRELSIKTQRVPDYSVNLAWNPNGERIAFTAEDGSIWQVDYPTLENLEQLTPSSPGVHDMRWSPDGSSIAFISGSDIYIVDTIK